MILAFCLMTNHVHLCLRTTEGGSALSVFMQQLNLRHAKKFNRVYRVRGHLYEGRYRVQVVDSHEYLLALIAYIHQNPVVARMVERPEQWEFSSHRAYLGEAYAWVKTDEVLWRAGGLDGYRKRMATRLRATERSQFEEDVRGRIPSLAGFRPLQDLGSPQVNPWSARFPRPAQPVQHAAAEFAALLGCDLAAAAAGKKGAAHRDAREKLAVALRRLGYRLHEIGAALGRDEATVSRMLGTARGRPDASLCAEDEAIYGLAA